MTVVEVSKHSYANGAAALLLAAYLVIVWYRGNLASLASSAQADFLGTGQQTAFWKWALALVILYALASTPSLRVIFAPFLFIVIVAMFIEAAEKGRLAGINKAFNAIFGTQTGVTNG
jgi:hypothetical protein